jgi:hypothetical protein
MRLTRRLHRAQLELLDAQLESYANWRAESLTVAESYHDWRQAADGQRTVAFARYVAALDREELAAVDYRRATELAPET